MTSWVRRTLCISGFLMWLLPSYSTTCGKEGKEKRDKKQEIWEAEGWVGSLDICSLKEKKGGKGENKDANKFLSL